METYVHLSDSPQFDGTLKAIELNKQEIPLYLSQILFDVASFYQYRRKFD